MADIKQAAKWMQDGKKVRRSSRPESMPIHEEQNFQRYRHKWIVDNNGEDGAIVRTEDLLADDWEIAEASK